MCACQRDRETESEKSPPRGDGHATIPSPPFSSHDLGHARTCAWCEFKPPSLGLELWLTTWEPSDIAIMLTTGPPKVYFLKDLPHIIALLFSCSYNHTETHIYTHVFLGYYF